ncbi:MAG TPA: hypothetical protein PLV92_18435, partial [Pirellulaceae bacterium]|nr:hypothetical protein [Pirellulaceae bacterium]
MTKSDEAKSSDQLWRRAARGDDYRFANSSGLSETLVSLARLPHWRPIELRESAVFNPNARPRLAMSFLDGLLAVHQGGGFTALLHPFRAATEAPRQEEHVAWCAEEAIACPRDASPFAPQILADRRRILFSHPGGAFAVHVWSLREWMLNHSPRRETLIGLPVADGWRLAAAPIVLDEKSLGVLQVDPREPRDSPRRFSWGVASATERGRWLVERMPLSVVGERCQVLQVERQVVAFATTRGHWMWSWGDALRGETPRLVKTWPTPEHAGRLVLDDEIDGHSSFHNSRQVLVRGANEREHADWYFTIEREAGRTLGLTRIPPLTSLD